MRASVLVASDRISSGQEQDTSGAKAAELLREAGADVAAVRVVPDEEDCIAHLLCGWRNEGVDLVLTVGGTGLAPRDVTPQATSRVLDRETPGITTALLAKGLESTPKAMLSRATSGVADRTLIVNLPGSASAVEELVPYLMEVVPHALEVIAGVPEAYES